MSLDEPTMLGPTPEERLQSQRRRKRLRMAVAAAVVITALVVAISLLPPATSKTVYIDPVQSTCGREGATPGGGSLPCTIVLDARGGSSVTVAEVRGVLINGTNTQPTITQKGNQVVITASVTLISQKCPGDIGCSVRPPSVGQVQVELTDGTAVSALLGAGGVIQ